MKKITLYTAATIDGLIARPDGRVDWLDAFSNDPGGDDYGYAEFISTIDTTIMGHETYRVSLALGGIRAMAGYSNYVLTRKNDREPEEHVTFLSENLPELLRDLRHSHGKNIWLLGGGQVNSFMLRHGLIDEIIVTTVPLILGEGLPLFVQPAPTSSFVLNETRSFANGLIQSTYSVAPNE